MPVPSLQKAVMFLLLLFLVCAGLHYAKPFLVPVAFAGLFAMLLLPVSSRLEGRGWNRGLTSVLGVLILLVFVAAISSLFVWQISDMAANADEIEKNMMKKVSELKDYVSGQFGISRQKQQEIIKEQQSGASGNLSGLISRFLGSFGAMLTNFILLLVYLFLFLFYRSHLKNFILKLVPPASRQRTTQTIEDARKVAQKYLTGLSLMIICLWIMYSIGYSIVGIKQPVFFAILCGLMEIIPFIGNLAGTAITILTSIAQGGDASLVIGILVTYGVVQFIQTYLLEPLVVGHEVNINPLFTIMGIVAGEFVWGIPGMILAIPALGITKIICDNVTALKPYGFLLGEEKKKDSKEIKEKIKGWFSWKAGEKKGM